MNPTRRGSSGCRVGLLLISDLEYGGAQRQVIELANNMACSRYELHVCTLFPHIPLAATLVNREFRLHLAPRHSKIDLGVVLRLVALFRRLKPQVVHTFFFDAELLGRLAGRLAAVPAIVGSERNANYVPKKRHQLLHALTRRYVDMYIANSSAGADFHSRVYREDRSRYRVVPNGVDVERFHPRNACELRARLGLDERVPLVGMFASFKPQKNHPLLLHAAVRVRERFPQTRFLFVGDEVYRGTSDSSGYKRQILEAVAALGLKDHCLFLGHQTEVETLYGSCNVTVLPSLFEGTPNAALESMACGVPVVATDVCDNARVVPNGRVGYTIPAGDDAALAERICRILGNTSLREELAQNARQWVTEEFSCRRLADRTADVYEEILRRKQVAPQPLAPVPPNSIDEPQESLK